MVWYRMAHYNRPRHYILVQQEYKLVNDYDEKSAYIVFSYNNFLECVV